MKSQREISNSFYWSSGKNIYLMRKGWTEIRVRFPTDGFLRSAFGVQPTARDGWTDGRTASKTDGQTLTLIFYGHTCTREPLTPGLRPQPQTGFAPIRNPNSFTVIVKESEFRILQTIFYRMVSVVYSYIVVEPKRI